MTILQSLKSLNPYPVPEATLRNIAEGAGMGDVDDELTAQVRRQAEYKRATAHVWLFLLAAPSISQNGISFSFSSDERRRFKAMATQLLHEIGDDTAGIGAGLRYGYRGTDF